jgi:hypothetical protein
MGGTRTQDSKENQNKFHGAFHDGRKHTKDEQENPDGNLQS